LQSKGKKGQGRKGQGRKDQGKSNMDSAAVMVEKVNREAMFYYMAMK
jgi:hypothetical protein